MIPIKDFLNKIKWDENLKEEDFTVYYMDNISKKLVAVKYTDIIKLEGSFILIAKGDEETFIPMHRIREVREKDKVVWKR
ncbi:DUF504 domain-containing protein [Candidatus Woesearchaeota archaeon]|nr:DUF504 domain-containing protein [Candidatus Woesearchaeota archaeon]